MTRISAESIRHSVRALTLAAILALPACVVPETPVQPSTTAAVKASKLSERRQFKNTTTYVEHGELKNIGISFGQHEDLILEQLGYWVKDIVGKYGLIMEEKDSGYRKHFYNDEEGMRKFNGLEIILTGYMGRKDEIFSSFINMYDENGSFKGNSFYFEFHASKNMPELDKVMPGKGGYMSINEDSAIELANLLFNHIPEDAVWESTQFSPGVPVGIDAFQTRFDIGEGQATVRIGADRSALLTYLID